MGNGSTVVVMTSKPAKYKIDYSVQFRRHAQPSHHLTDDPVSATEFLSELLERGFRIMAIHHEDMQLSKREFDGMVKAAANLFAARHLCHSLGISAEEERYRFGFSG
jgi:hypothetical protein